MPRRRAWKIQHVHALDELAVMPRMLKGTVAVSVTVNNETSDAYSFEFK